MRVLLAIILFLSTQAQAQRPFSRDFWLNENQRPVNVNAITEAPTGYIWLATEEGVFRFNGRAFLPVVDSIRRKATAISAVNNDVFVGYEDGTLARSCGDKITRLGSVNVGPKTMIRSICSDGRGMLWLSTEEGLFIYTNGRYFQVNSDHGLADNFVYEVAGGKSFLLAGTDNGIGTLRASGGKLITKRYGTQQGLPDNIVNVVKAVPGSSYFWVGTNEGGVARLQLDGEELAVLKYVPRKWQWGQVNDIYAVSVKEAWAVTEAGYLLHITAGDSLQARPYHFEGKKMRKVLHIRSGNLWVATNEGLTVVTVSHAGYSILQPPYFFSTLTAAVCRDGRFWLGQERELLSYPLLADTATPAREAILPANITCMYMHGGSGIWIGTFGKGLWHYGGGKLEQVRDVESMNDANILSVTTYNSRLWVASLNGVDELDVKDERLQVVVHHNKSTGIGSDYVYQLYNDGKGKLWFATDGAGVAMYDGKKFHRWDSSSGMTAKVVYSVTVDAFGNAWAGTPGKGVFRFDGKRWEQMTTENGLQDMNVSSVVANKTGQVLVVTQNGIDEWFPGSNLFRRFNKKTNLDIEHISSVLNCVARDTAGNVYIPFDKGMAVFTNVRDTVDLRPGISINEVQLFFKPVSKERKEFEHNENQLTFVFDGINYSNIERLHYRYRLEGYHDDWIYTDDQAVTFSQLPRGQFEFRIQASLDKDFEEANEVAYSFEINAPFWKTPWFLLLAAAVVFSLLYIYIKLRERSLKNVNKLQRERMKFEYEHLKSQVNPHFLFNSLNTLSALIEEDTKKAVDYTSQLSDLYRSMLSYKDMDLISLEDELDIIERYMYIQRTRFGDALKWSVNVPEKVKKTRKVIPLALQILVENAIKHNTVSRFKPLTIYIEAGDEEISVRNELQPKITQEKGEGLGLSNIQRRYSLLTKKHITKTVSDDQYIVSLPLL